MCTIHSYIHHTCSCDSLLYHSVRTSRSMYLVEAAAKDSHKTLTISRKLEILNKLVDAYVIRYMCSCHYHVYFFPVQTNSLIRTLLYTCWFKAVQISEGVLYSHTKSCHPKHWKTAIHYSQALRIKRICLEWKNLSSQINQLKHHLSKRGYSEHLLDSTQIEHLIPRMIAVPCAAFSRA